MVKENYSEWPKQDLIDEIKKLKKRKKYGIVWEDKPEQVAESCKEKLPILAEDKSKEIITDKEKPVNILIEGDNYHALSVLNYTHKGKIDVIYIDPPYNTGRSKEWRFNDNWVDSNDSYRHSKWLSMMIKRLKLAKSLLREGGVIFISIDDNEQSPLRILCDWVFGEKNRIDRGLIIWNNAGSTKGFSYIAKNHEYILAYAKNIKKVKNYFGKNFPDKCGSVEHYCFNAPSYKNPDCQVIFEKGTKIRGVKNAIFKDKVGDKVKLKIIPKKMEFKDGILIEDVILEGAFPYRFQIKEYYENLKRGLPTFDRKGQKWEEIFFNSSGLPKYFKYKNTIIFDSVIRGVSNYGANEILDIFGKKVFDFPKPTDLIMRLLEYFAPKNGIVLDFMAGTGTTGHSVLKVNQEDKGNRKFILCTNDENRICTEVCFPRIQKTIKGYENLKEEFVKGLGGNLKYFKTDFVDANPTDRNKKKLVDKSTEMLCLKEDCFDEIKKGHEFKIFKNSQDKYLGIVYDDEGIEEFKKEVKKTKKKFVVYVFSLDESAREEEFEDISELVELKPIPEVILNVYRRIFK